MLPPSSLRAAQRAKEERYNKEKDRKREKERERRDDRKGSGRDVDNSNRHRDRDYKASGVRHHHHHDRSGKDEKKSHEHRHRRHEGDSHRGGKAERDRSGERERKKEQHRHHKKSRTPSSGSERSGRSPQKKTRQEDTKLFERVLDPNFKKKEDEVVEVVDWDVSPVEIRENVVRVEDVEHAEMFTPTDDEHPGSLKDDDVVEVPDVISLNDESDEGKYLKSPEADELEELTEAEQRLHRKSVEDGETRRQKMLIAQLPVFYPGLMGCRNIDEYECVNRVDEGTFGVVYRGKDKRTDEIVALKRLKMEKEKEGFPITALREINMLLKAGNHRNIVHVKEILVGSNMDKIYLAMEFVEHDMRSLLDTMSRRNKRFSTGEQKTLMQQLLSGIEHMHKLWILHRDLKTSNLLLSHTGVLKIADFGLAREYGDPLKKFTSVVVTLWYRSPELLLGTRLYSTPVDMWSVGCIMAEFILLKPLFQGAGELGQIKKIFMEMGTPTESIWPGVTELDGWKALTFEKYPYNQLRKKFLAGRLLNDTGFKLLNGLLTLDPKNRFTATQALDHEWFSEEPLPVPPEEFPTFPAKSEQNKAPPPAAAKKKQLENRMAHVDPETAKLLKQFEVRPEQVKPGGFSLKFDPTRF
uniref:cyclin-dependent kinase n=1 Tax=Caenorhabditis japonica TaxID=281687 RepID=A0A8R1HVW0_CAEJA